MNLAAAAMVLPEPVYIVVIEARGERCKSAKVEYTLVTRIYKLCKKESRGMDL
jgi:hypothetical protein